MPGQCCTPFISLLWNECISRLLRKCSVSRATLQACSPRLRALLTSFSIQALNKAQVCTVSHVLSSQSLYILFSRIIIQPPSNCFRFVSFHKFSNVIALSTYLSSSFPVDWNSFLLHKSNLSIFLLPSPSFFLLLLTRKSPGFPAGPGLCFRSFLWVSSFSRVSL